MQLLMTIMLQIQRHLNQFKSKFKLLTQIVRRLNLLAIYSKWNFCCQLQKVKYEEHSLLKTITFSKKFNLPINFSDTLVGQIKATDSDTNENLLKYSLRSTSKFQSLFQIDSTTGDLRVSTNDTKLLENNEYKLDVQVTDGTHVAHGKVIIKTMNNDKLLRRPNALKLAKLQYVVHTTENRTKTTDTQRPILAIDWPLNANNGETFSFRIVSNISDKLILNPTNGLLYLNPTNPLDREQEAKFEVAVLIKSQQNSQRYVQTIVQINLNDINDCAPTFDQQEYTVQMSQGAKMADKLLQIKATDLDLGSNGIVRYSLGNGAPNFVEINANDGRLLVKSQATNDELTIGREYLFKVVATDQGKNMNV